MTFDIGYVRLLWSAISGECDDITSVQAIVLLVVDSVQWNDSVRFGFLLLLMLYYNILMLRNDFSYQKEFDKFAFV